MPSFAEEIELPHLDDRERGYNPAGYNILDPKSMGMEARKVSFARTKLDRLLAQASSLPKALELNEFNQSNLHVKRDSKHITILTLNHRVRWSRSGKKTASQYSQMVPASSQKVFRNQSFTDGYPWEHHNWHSLLIRP